MNQIERRRNPEYLVIPDYFIHRFESEILDGYYRRIEDQQHLRFGLPHIADDLILYDAIHPETWAAAYWGYETKNPHYFLNLMRELDRQELFKLTNDVYEKLEIQPNHIFDDCVYEDVKTFLDFHSMSYVDVDVSSGNKFKNLPIKQVW